MENTIREKAKNEVLHKEGDAYFERNLTNGKIELAKGCMLLDEFLSENISGWSAFRILEIGCCYGYNLMHLCGKYGFLGYGIEPSEKAVHYGERLLKEEGNKNIILKQGTADKLEFEAEYFNIVIMAFCMFWVDRKYMMRAISEADRVLKTGGYLVSWDFDTKVPYRRVNIHNVNVPTYKYDLANLFLGNPQYSLIEKRSFSHDGNAFHKDIQERCALNIMFKDEIENTYIFS